MTLSDRQQALRQQQMDVLQNVTAEIDSLPTYEAKREVVAFLVASIGTTFQELSKGVNSGYRPKPKRRW